MREKIGIFISKYPYVPYVMGILGGAIVGFQTGTWRQHSKDMIFMEQKISEEIETAREYYAMRAKRGAYITPQQAVEALVPEEEREVPDEAQDALQSYIGKPAPEERVEILHNVFTDAEDVDDYVDEFDYDEEVKNRDPRLPYIVTKDEFMENPKDFNQVTLTYFEGDEVLSDERDQTIEDVEGLVGEDNLQKFGHGSGDHNVVYIRNEHISLDMEVLKSKGRYAHEVLGFIEHSDHHKIKRFRSDDE